jgi:hypothetical protein
MKTWYWGNYVTTALPNTKISDYELYFEEKHGWHNAEEFKTGIRLTPYNKGEK